MSHENSSSSGKRSYLPPICTRRSIPEIATLVRKEVSARGKTSEAEGRTVPSQRSILVVEGYQGHVAEIGQVPGVDTSRLQQKPVVNGEELVAMQLNERHGSSSPCTFLLLDLRRRLYGGDRPLNSIARQLDTNNTAPVVILVTSLEQFYRWESIDRKHCWQYHGHPSSVDLTKALQCLLLLWTELARFPKEKPALEKAVFVDYYCSHRN